MEVLSRLPDGEYWFRWRMRPTIKSDFTIGRTSAFSKTAGRGERYY
jgi:hypothetical protein